MQHLKLFFAIIFSSFLLYSCTGNTNANTGKESDSVASSSATASTSDASFSIKLMERFIRGVKTILLLQTGLQWIQPTKYFLR